MTTDTATDVAHSNLDAVRKFNDALNNRDRTTIAAAFTAEGVFRPAAAGASFEGREAVTQALMGFLDKHESGQFETLAEFAAGDDVFSEWRWTGTTKDGEAVSSHGADHFRLEDGLIVEKNTWRKV